MDDHRTLACSLPADVQRERGEVQELARSALLARDRAERAVVITFRAEPTVEAALRDLIRREAECCPFLTYELDRDEGEVMLRVSAPPGAEEMLDLIYESSAP
jgi:hypothetical protein